MYCSPNAFVPRLILAFAVLIGISASTAASDALTQSDVRCGTALDTPTVDTASTPASPTSLEWRALTDMPRPRSELDAGVIDGWIYVAGGFGGLTEVDCFHPATGTWATASDLPLGIHHPGVTALDGQLYVAGGYTEDGDATDTLWAYDPRTEAWEEQAPMPTERGALGLAAIGGKLYAIGGTTDRWGGPVTGAVEVYDPAIDRWESAADLPTPREHLAVAAGDGRIFAVGGRANRDERGALAAAAEAYDPDADTWEALPPLPTPRGGGSAIFASDRMIVLGGERGTTTFDTVEALDVVTETWDRLPPMPTARHGLASAVVGNTIYAIAGSTEGGGVQNTGANEALTLSPTFATGERSAAPRPLVYGRKWERPMAARSERQMHFRR